MEHKCIVDCGGDIGEFQGEFQGDFSDKKEGVKEDIPLGVKMGAKYRVLIFKNSSDCLRTCSRDVSRCFDTCPCHRECFNGCPCTFHTDYCDIENQPPNNDDDIICGDDCEVECEDCEGGSSFDKFNVFSSVLYLSISFLLNLYI